MIHRLAKQGILPPVQLQILADIGAVKSYGHLKELPKAYICFRMNSRGKMSGSICEKII